jgi:hypothetical protein
VKSGAQTLEKASASEDGSKKIEQEKFFCKIIFSCSPSMKHIVNTNTKMYPLIRKSVSG